MQSNASGKTCTVRWTYDTYLASNWRPYAYMEYVQRHDRIVSFSNVWTGLAKLLFRIFSTLGRCMWGSACEALHMRLCIWGSAYEALYEERWKPLAGARLGHVVCSTLFDAGICTVGQATRTKASGYWENKAWFSQLGNPWGENYYLLDGGIFVLRLFVSSVSV